MNLIIGFGAVESLGTFGAKASLNDVVRCFCTDSYPLRLWLGGRVRIYKCRGITNVLIFEPPDRPIGSVFYIGDKLFKILKYFYLIYFVFVIANTAYAASCATDYGVAVHPVDLDFNINNPEYPDEITLTDKGLNTGTFVLSDDGNCYSGYEPYTRGGGDVYPLIEDSDLCADGYYRSAGNCVAFTDGGCPTGRYNSAVNIATFVASEDGNCYSGFDVYTRSGDDIYPLVDSSNSILCPAGQYMANGTCTAYPIGTCPENMKNTTTNSATWSAMTNGVCPSNYTEYTISTIEYACDTYVSHITSETPACLLMCTNGQTFSEVNSCSALCADHHQLMTDTGLEFPMYTTKQITPSLNIQVGNNVCYVNLVSGASDDAINIKYNNTTYHTVK